MISNKKKLLFKNKEWLYQKYIQEELSARDIAKLCNIGNRQIRRYLQKFNIAIRKGKESYTKSVKIKLDHRGCKNPNWGLHRSLETIKKMQLSIRQAWVKKFPLNINYFKKLNKRNAYVLGYLFADSHLKRRNKFGSRQILSFLSIDKELIDKIKHEFGIDYRKTRIRIPTNNGKICYCISICNFDFIEHLKNLGLIIGKKSDRLSVPKNISNSNQYFLAFLRGFFDGDGCINSISYQCSPVIQFTSRSYEFLSSIKKILYEKFDIDSKIKTRKNNCHVLYFCGKKKVGKLYKLMYQKGNNLFLSRKKQRFDEFFKKKEENKNAKNR